MRGTLGAIGLILCGALVILLGFSAAGAEPQAGENSPNQSSGKAPAETVPQTESLQLGALAKGQTLLGKTMIGTSEQPIGTVRDLVLDLETGHVALMVIAIQDTDPTFCMALPARVVRVDKELHFSDTSSSESMARARRMPAATLRGLFDRAWAMIEYTTFGSPPYWAAEKSAAEPGFDLQDYRLALHSELRDTPIVGKDGQVLGHIDDFAVATEDMRLAYVAAALKDKADVRHPIPLGAFVVPEIGKPWQLNVAEEAVRNTPSFPADKWPAQLDRSWTEFVHVRYGGMPQGGVRHRERADVANQSESRGPDAERARKQ